MQRLHFGFNPGCKKVTALWHSNYGKQNIKLSTKAGFDSNCQLGLCIVTFMVFVSLVLKPYFIDKVLIGFVSYQSYPELGYLKVA